MKEMNIKINGEERENDVMQAAADSLVHFVQGDAPLYGTEAQDDGLLETEVARTVYLCMTEKAG